MKPGKGVGEVHNTIIMLPLDMELSYVNCILRTLANIENQVLAGHRLGMAEGTLLQNLTNFAEHL